MRQGKAESFDTGRFHGATGVWNDCPLQVPKYGVLYSVLSVQYILTVRSTLFRNVTDTKTREQTAGVDLVYRTRENYSQLVSFPPRSLCSIAVMVLEDFNFHLSFSRSDPGARTLPTYVACRMSHVAFTACRHRRPARPVSISPQRSCSSVTVANLASLEGRLAGQEMSQNSGVG